MAELNGACGAGFDYTETLGELRTRVIRRLGYAAQAANPPSGMADLIDDFLRSAQQFIYRRLYGTGGSFERFFEWTLTVGDRFYDTQANTDACTKKLRPEQITGVWIEDMNGSWSRLSRGIDPALYTSITQNGLPCFYELRQELELFPAPDQAYKLHVKGRFALTQFTEDDDPCCVDPDVLFLNALSRAKNHYQQADAGDIAAEARALLDNLRAAAHGDRRYVPGTQAAPVLTKPVLIDVVP